MAKRTDTSGADREIDSLNAYMRGINELGDYSTEQQSRLCHDFELASDRLRDKICVFGFTAAEYIRSIDSILERDTESADVFIVSSLRDMGKTRSEQFAFLRNFRQETSAALSELRECFFSGRECGEAREKLKRTLSRCRLTLQKVYELMDICGNYLRMLDKNFDWGMPLKITGQTPGTGFVEEKLLFSAAELPAEIAGFDQAREKLFKVRNDLAEANLKLVISIATRFCNQKTQLSDLIQEGNLGLMRALERIDFSLGYRFSTYASWWIRHRIARAVNTGSRVIRLPMHMVKLINDINQAEQRFIQLNGREPEISELAKILELPPARVSAVRKMAIQTVSLQSPVNSDEDASELGDFVADRSAGSPDAQLSKKFLGERLKDMLDSLTEREQQLLIMRFGLFGQPSFTLAEISAHFNLTRERCRQIELGLLAKLRTPEKLKYIDGTVNFDDF